MKILTQKQWKIHAKSVERGAVHLCFVSGIQDLISELSQSIYFPADIFGRCCKLDSGWCEDSPILLQSQGKDRKKRKRFKAKIIKRLSPRSKCYHFNHSRVSRITKHFLSTNYGGRQHFSVLHDSSTLESIATALVNSKKQ